MSTATNAERIAKHIKEYGPKGMLIHTIPGTPFWLVCEENKNKRWKITVCHPMHRKAYNIATDISEAEHFQLWNELVQLELSRRVKTALKTLRKEMENYLRNRVTQPAKKLAKLMSSPFKKDRTLRVTVQIAKASLKELRTQT